MRFRLGSAFREVSAVVVFLYCVVFLIAIAVSVAVATHSWGSRLDSILSAAVVAAITVLGAAILTDKRDQRLRAERLEAERTRSAADEATALKKRRNMVWLCFDFLCHLGHAVNDAQQLMENDANLSDAVRPVIAVWETLAKYEPFDELDDHFQRRMMLEMAAKCRRLYGYLDIREPHSRDERGELVGRRDRRTDSPWRQVQEIQEDCIRALPIFHGTLAAIDGDPEP